MAMAGTAQTDRRSFIHEKQPDYSRPALQIPPQKRQRIFNRLCFLYGPEQAEKYMPELERIMRVHYAHKPEEMVREDERCDVNERFTEKDIILITYGDIIKGRDPSPIKTLARFCDTYLEGNINTIHILPFFPYSSDRGFSVIDFETVDPRIGTWEDLEELKPRYKLMFDCVFNHISSKSKWFQEFLNGNPYYKDFFIVFDSPDAISEEHKRLIFRPRTTELLTRYETVHGPKYVWTTFSPDQIDLNYKNPEVLMRILEVLLMYVRRGADLLRLDAATFLWYELGTSCANLPQTHEIIKLIRDVLDVVAPRVCIVTETNVPHKENIAYFGDGTDEAQMVYNFALPPMVLYTFYKEDATRLLQWVATLEKPSNTTAFFNFLDSHDGIGLMAVRDILSDSEIEFIIDRAVQHGSLISYRKDNSGTKVPYELNITWFSALNREDADEDIAYQVKRFVASRIISLVLQGVPGIYLHSLIGTKNDIDAVLATNSNREINRSVIDEEAIYKALNEPFSKIARINRELGRLITLRTRQRAFHPNGPQKVLFLAPEVFSLLRCSPEEDQHILTLVNVSNRVCHLKIPLKELQCDDVHWYDIVSGMEWMADGNVIHVTIYPYDVLWLTPYREIKNTGRIDQAMAL